MIGMLRAAEATAEEVGRSGGFFVGQCFEVSSVEFCLQTGV